MDMGSSISIDERLRFAIANKRLVQLRYHGRSRVAEPHDYGVQKGIERLFVFQLRATGPSREGVRGWRLLDLAKIEECVVLDETFAGSRGASHPSHMEWEVVYARVG
jgi:hypothetical protein